MIEKTGEQRGQEAARMVSNMLNSYSSDGERAFVAQMANDHRSLQQAFTRLCVAWLRTIADARYDLRNEASVKLAKEVLPLLDANPLPRI